MKNLILYGAPAAGKGTQCEYLISEYGYELISIGQLLRNARTPDTEIGRAIIESQDKGVLTPDYIVEEVIKEELLKQKGNHLIMDGFPRSLKQAKFLDTVFDNYKVINIEVDEDVALKRTLGRVTCSGCGKIYNNFIKEMTPKIDGICDICGGELLGRSDDNEESFKTRFEVYQSNVKSILDYYNKKGVLSVIKSKDTPDETFIELKKVIGK